MNPEIFSQALLNWFEQYGRHDLPWQKNITPYRVWVSEIMLQQTQVTTVIPYFERFMKKFPTVSALALGKNDEVLAHWSGLGYYARARHLHRTAQIIHETYHDYFPETVEALEALPGIGHSTAGAILSLGMKKHAVILDGNVKRVLARFFVIDAPINHPVGTKLLWRLAEEYTPKNRCWDYNQAMMDIGAIICTRTKPKCLLCPVQKGCSAYQQLRQTAFPVKKGKVNRSKKSIYMLLLKNADNCILLEKRPSIGIWGGLWSFPECPLDENITLWCENKLGFNVTIEEYWLPFLHIFTHFELEIKPVILRVGTQAQLMESQPQIWYKEHSTLPGGIAAPVSRLLKTLQFYPHKGEEGLGNNLLEKAGGEDQKRYDKTNFL